MSASHLRAKAEAVFRYTPSPGAAHGKAGQGWEVLGLVNYQYKLTTTSFQGKGWLWTEATRSRIGMIHPDSVDSKEGKDPFKANGSKPVGL